MVKIMFRFNAFDGECYLWFPVFSSTKAWKHLLAVRKIIHDFQKSSLSSKPFRLIFACRNQCV